MTTGILRCNVFQMLLGTLPVIFLIAPSVMAGAFMLKIGQTGSEEICPALPPPPPPPPPIGTIAHGTMAGALVGSIIHSSPHVREVHSMLDLRRTQL